MSREIKIPDSGAFRISASAGSGKTHNLTRVFLQRMLRSKYAFRGILAITFTNKAAGELRERILKNLKELSDATKPCRETGLFGFSNRQELAVAAADVLDAVMHNPDWLNVGTIDSFFQQVFSALAIETGLPGSLKTELDLNLVKAEILEEVLTHQNPAALTILIENLSNQLISTGKDWRPAPYLRKKVLDVVFEEPVISLFINQNENALNEELLQNAIGSLNAYLQRMRDDVSAAASDIIAALESFGIRTENLNSETDHKFIGELNKIITAADNGEMPEVMKSYSSKGTFNYKCHSRPISSSEYDVISPLLSNYAETAGNRATANYKLAENLLFHVASIRLLVFMREVLQQKNLEQNRFLLTEVKFLLASFLETSDIPYLFEKTGSRLHTLLIDEFQDTDRVQWKVLKALAEIVIENDGLFCVVGDVKQSIYSWRGADSSLFRQGLNKDLNRFELREDSLETNYRSLPGLVAFNNWLFTSLAEGYARHLANAGHLFNEEHWDQLFKTNYRDVIQETSEENAKAGTGFVNVRVRPKASRNQGGLPDDDDEEANSFMHWLPAEIMRLQDAGIKASDIAVLVRKNADVGEAIRMLDLASRTMPDRYDFSFNTGANTKAGDQPLFIFLIKAMQFGMGQELKSFDFEEMRSLATELQLNSEFQEPGWEKSWTSQAFSKAEPDIAYLEQVAYFRLDEHLHLQAFLLSFQELLYSYLREDSILYPDFFQWWQQKAAEKQIPLGSGGGGITIMTIHRSKGLDFGVVILPVFSTAQGDAKTLHDAYFWANGSDEPWNSHPLLRGKASKKMLESDLGALYQEDVFRRAAEALNTYYVACTRPRFGLVIDITIDGNPEKPEASAYRLPMQTAALIMKGGNLPFEEFGYNLQPAGEDLMVDFSIGEITRPKIEKEENNRNTPPFAEFRMHGRKHQITFSGKQSLETGQVRIGKLVHDVLEKTQNAISWRDTLREESGKYQLMDKAEIMEAEQLLARSFDTAEIQNWFSARWNRYPEAEMYDTAGNLWRADLILTDGKETLVIDFKTGEALDDHQHQLRNYMNVLEQASGEKPKGYLFYMNKAEIVLAG